MTGRKKKTVKRSPKIIRKRSGTKRDLFAEMKEGIDALADARDGKRTQKIKMSPEVKDTLRALRRAAKRALELGLQTGTPVYVWKDGRIVDLTKGQRQARSSKSKSSKTKRSSR